MAEITYWKLKAGTPINNGDTLTIYGIPYKAIETGGFFFLTARSGTNNRVFEKLGLSDAEKLKWAKEYASKGHVCNGGFPEFDNKEDFVSFIKAIYEEPLLKKGDVVKIKKREGDENDYPYVYVGEMQSWEGELVKIRQVSTGSEFQINANLKFYNGDIHYYYIEELDGTPINYTWHSSMFEMQNFLREGKKTSETKQAVPDQLIKSSEVIQKEEKESTTDLTYWRLKGGHVLPHDGDTLLIYGLRYTVREHSEGRWYMSCYKGSNSKIFTLFGMSDAQKMSWASEYCHNGTCMSGAFPEFTDRKDFTSFIIALYEYELFKEGDTVIIKPREGASTDYPCSYVAGMDKWEGKWATISKVMRFWGPEDESGRKYANGDIHYYELKEDESKWQWHSSMFDFNSHQRCEEDKHSLKQVIESWVSPDKKKEVPSEEITLNKSKKHFKTTIVL